MDGSNAARRDTSVIGSRELPIPPGRVLWFIARWEQAKARHRTASPRALRFLTGAGIYERATRHLWAWTCREYPGRDAMVAALCGVSYGTARHYARQVRRVPRHVALILADYLRSHAAQSLALALELEQSAKKSEENNPRGVGFRQVKVRDLSGIPRDGRVRKSP